MMLCAGIDITTNKPVIALSGSTESPALVSINLTIPLRNADPAKTARLLPVIAAHLTANRIIEMIPKNGCLLIHEADPALKSVLSSRAKQVEIHACFTTSPKGGSIQNCLYIHPNLPQHLVSKILPKFVSTFIDLSTEARSVEVGSLIASCLPQPCITSAASQLFGTKPSFVRVMSLVSEVEDVLREAHLSTLAFKLDIDLSQGENVIPLQKVSNQKAGRGSLAVLNWTAHSVPVAVQVIDEGDTFKADKTYLLVGLSEEIGQSLCR